MKIPKTLTIYTDSVEMHEKFTEATRSLSVEKLAGVEFVWTSCSRSSCGVQASLTEIVTVKREWTGESGPPVGKVCEHRTGPGMSWTRATVLAYGEKKVFYRDCDGHEWSRLYDEIEFRPIRTPEQIAAEEREKAIEQMLVDVGSTPKMETMNAIYFGALYDAGYRNGYRKPTDQ